MNRSSGLDIAGISAAYERQVRETCKGELPIALELAGRLDPMRWKLEWNAAAWVGEALLIDAAIVRQLTVSNVLGLAAIVLFDDIEDGEADAAGLGDGAAIADGLYQSFMAPYQLLFDGDSPFWAERDRLMATWRGANAVGADLSARGAPLKVSVTALCMLAKAPERLSQLSRCLDHALTAMVLYDHFVDWREDVAADRWNAFVEHASTRMGSHAEDRHTRRNVEAAMLGTDLISTFFDSIQRELKAAWEQAVDAGVGGLVDHLAGVERDLDAQGCTLAARYRALGASAQELVFGGYPIQAA